MPRKTKKQKILAEIHRQTILVKDNNLNFKLTTQDKSEKLSSITSDDNYANYAPVYQDLKKISLFTFLALIFQGVLYFLLNDGNFR